MRKGWCREKVERSDLWGREAKKKKKITTRRTSRKKKLRGGRE